MGCNAGRLAADLDAALDGELAPSITTSRAPDLGVDMERALGFAPAAAGGAAPIRQASVMADDEPIDIDRKRGLASLKAEFCQRVRHDDVAGALDLSYPAEWFDTADNGYDATLCRSLFAAVFHGALRDDLREALRAEKMLRKDGKPPVMTPWLRSQSPFEVASNAGFDAQALVGRCRAAFRSWDTLKALEARLRPQPHDKQRA